MVTALVLMVSAGAINFVHRRNAERAKLQGMKMTLVPDSAADGTQIRCSRCG